MVSFALLVVAAGRLLGGQASQTGAPEPQSIPTFRSSVEAVQVTVIVTDASGTPVAGLTQSDFELLENGTPTPITTFAAVDIPIERTDVTRAASDVLDNEGPPGRTYVIVLDDMGPDQASRARPLLREFIEQYFGPNDRGAIVASTNMTAVGGAGQEFTGDPRRLLDALDRFKGGMKVDGSAAPPPGGRSLDENLREKYVMGGLRALTESLAKMPGRKAVLLVSDKGLGPGFGDPLEVCGCDATKLVNYRPSFWRNLFIDMVGDFQDALSAATRGNVAFYPISSGGTSGNRSLKALADFTGGFMPQVSARSTAGFERLVRDQSTHYLLGFNSASDRRDGGYVGIDVRVKRAGLQVRSLNGYLAPRHDLTPEKRPTGLLAAVWDAVASPLTTSGVPLRVHAAPFKGKGKNATVAITLEIAASKLNLVEENGAHRGELEIAFALTDREKNRRWPIWRHRANVALKPENYERVTHGALRVLSQLELPKGHYQLRASAGGAALAGSVVYDVTVPDFGDGFSLSGVEVSSAQASETFTVSPHASLAVNFPAPPTTAREFSRNDTLTLFAEAYESRRKPHTVTFSLELRDEAGNVLDAETLQRQSPGKPTAASVYQFSQSLRLERVPAGRYTLHIESRSSLDVKEKAPSPPSFDIPITVRQ